MNLLKDSDQTGLPSASSHQTIRWGSVNFRPSVIDSIECFSQCQIIEFGTERTWAEGREILFRIQVERVGSIGRVDCTAHCRSHTHRWRLPSFVVAYVLFSPSFLMRGCCDFLLPPVVFLSFQFFFQTLFLPMIGPMTGQSIQLDASLSDCCSTRERCNKMYPIKTGTSRWTSSSLNRPDQWTLHPSQKPLRNKKKLVVKGKKRR